MPLTPCRDCGEPVSYDVHPHNGIKYTPGSWSSPGKCLKCGCFQPYLSESEVMEGRARQKKTFKKFFIVVAVFLVLWVWFLQSVGGCHNYTFGRF